MRNSPAFLTVALFVAVAIFCTVTGAIGGARLARGGLAALKFQKASDDGDAVPLAQEPARLAQAWDAAHHPLDEDDVSPTAPRRGPPCPTEVKPSR